MARGLRPSDRSRIGALTACALALLAVAVPPARAASAPAPVPVEVVQTDPTHLARAALTREPDVTLSAAPLPRGVRVLDVHDGEREQSIIGFGGAMTDSAANLLYDGLTPGGRQHALAELFDPHGGIGLDFVRVPVGASDYTVGGQAYTYDDQPAGRTDPTLADFSIAHDLPYILPTLAQVRKINPLVDLIATTWTAPAWMKANDLTSDYGDSGTLLPADYPVFAAYLVKFVEAYGAAGIPIWAITPENEPGTMVGYPSMNLTPQQEATFIAQDLAPAFAAAKLPTRIYGGDTGAAEPSYALADSSDPAAAAATSGEAWHCYGGQGGISAFHDLHPGVQELMTECSPGIIPYDAGEAAIDALRNWASTALLWNLALDPQGGPVAEPNGCPNCTALLSIDPAAHHITYTRNFYELGQLSKFIERGAIRVATPRWVSDVRSPSDDLGVSAGLDNVAVINPDGSHVLVAENHSPTAITFGVSWQDRRFDYTLPAGAIVTFRWAGSTSRSARPATDACLNAGVSYTRSGGATVALPDC